MTLHGRGQLGALERYRHPMGFQEWADRTIAAGKAAEARQAEIKAAGGGRGKNLGSFEGITLRSTSVHYKGDGGSVKGATARVEAAADVEKRITATRLLAVGIFALAWKKRNGSVFLTVDHPDYQLLVAVPVKHEADARKFASKINNASKNA
jgi:hypothetical protein